MTPEQVLHQMASGLVSDLIDTAMVGVLTKSDLVTLAAKHIIADCFAFALAHPVEASLLRDAHMEGEEDGSETAQAILDMLKEEAPA